MPPPAMPPLPPSPPPLPLQPIAPPEAAPASLQTADMLVAIAYSICAVGSAIGMASIWDLERLKRERSADASLSDGRVAATECAQRPTDGAAADVARPGLPNVARHVAPAAAAEADTNSEGSAAPLARASATSARFSFRKLAGAVFLWRARPVVLLLAPVQITFGLCAALLGYEISGNVVRIAFPANTVVAAGLLSALVSLVAALLQVPFKALSARVSKGPVMLIGLSAFAALGGLVLALDDESLAHYLPLVLTYLLQGVGRACYEGTNKALYADRFPADSEAAFANIVLANGAASAVAYFTFPELSREARATASLASAAVAIVAYVGAEAVHAHERRARVL